MICGHVFAMLCEVLGRSVLLSGRCPLPGVVRRIVQGSRKGGQDSVAGRRGDARGAEAAGTNHKPNRWAALGCAGRCWCMLAGGHIHSQDRNACVSQLLSLHQVCQRLAISLPVPVVLLLIGSTPGGLPSTRWQFAHEFACLCQAFGGKPKCRS